MQLALDLGPPEVKKTAYDMGIRTKLDGYPAESLGGLTLGVSPLEMANAFATIASGGYRNRPTAIKKITFPDGKSDLPRRFKVKRTKAFEDWVTAEATRILVKNIQGGTGTKANIGCPAGGKTGTTDEFNDAWFVGFTPRLATATWVGYPNAQVQMKTEYHGGSVAGGTFPAEIWGDYMKSIKGKFCGDFKPAKTAAQFTPFFGKYARGGGRNTGDTSRTTVRQRRTAITLDGADDADDPGARRSQRQAGEGPGRGSSTRTSTSPRRRASPTRGARPRTTRAAAPRPPTADDAAPEPGINLPLSAPQGGLSMREGSARQHHLAHMDSQSEEVLYGNWCREVVQRREGFRVHHPR